MRSYSEPVGRYSYSGFSIIEVLLAGSLFIMIVSTLVVSYLYGQEATVLAGRRARAVMLAEEGLQAARNLKDETFGNLVDGTHGLVISGNTWALSGSSDVTGIFTRQLTISPVDADRKDVTATVMWQQNLQRQGQIDLVTRFTNWEETAGGGTCINQSDYLTIDASSPTLTSGNRTLGNIFVENTNASCNVIIDKMTLTWTNLSRNIVRVRIDNTSVWTGSASSGTLLEVDDTTIANADGQLETTYRYDGTMNNNTFTLTITLSDATTVVETNITP